MFKKTHEKFSIRKLTVGATSVLIASLLFLGNAVSADDLANSQASAGQSLVNDNSRADESDLLKAQEEEAQAISKAKETGVTVTANKEVMTSDLALAVSKTQSDTAAIKEASDHQVQNNAEFETAMKTYEEEVAANEVAYQAALADYESKVSADGYLSQAAGQKLIFKTGSEQNTVAVVDSNAIPVDQASAISWVNDNATADKDYTLALVANPDYIDDGSYYFLQPNATTSVTYNNLENAYFDNKKIASVVYTYTVEETGGADKVLVKIFNDPTVTIDVFNLNKDTQIGMTVRFLDENGQAIDVSGALVSFASLNSNAVYDDLSQQYLLNSNEYVTRFKGDFIPINGSSVAYDSATGKAFAATSNESLEQGSHFAQDDWDGTNLSWYGAIAGQVSQGDTISFSFGSKNRSSQWFAFNSSVDVYQVPTLKVAEKPTLKVVDVSYTPYTYQAPQDPDKSLKTQKVDTVQPELTTNSSASPKATNPSATSKKLPATGDEASMGALTLGSIFLTLGLVSLTKKQAKK